MSASRKSLPESLTKLLDLDNHLDLDLYFGEDAQLPLNHPHYFKDLEERMERFDELLNILPPATAHYFMRRALGRGD